MSDEGEAARIAQLDQEAVQVEEENARLRDELVQIEEQLGALADLNELDDEDKPTALELELAQLEVTLDYLASYSISPSSVASRSPLLSSHLAALSMQTTVTSLEEALKRERDKLEAEHGRMERDRQWMEDAEVLNGTLERRAASARGEADEDGKKRRDGEVLVLRSQARIQRLTSYFRQLQGGLVQFVDERLVESEPDAEGGASDSAGKEGGTSKKRRNGSTNEAFNLHSYVHADGPGEPAEKRAFELKKLIEVLMNAAASADPSAPPAWTRLPSLTPLPREELVRFLLRARIARENSKNADEIRLEDFAVR